jgi:hypothetical protein
VMPLPPAPGGAATSQSSASHRTDAAIPDAHVAAAAFTQHDGPAFDMDSIDDPSFADIPFDSAFESTEASGDDIPFESQSLRAVSSTDKPPF